MPIETFQANTAVAYVDVSGFKLKMRNRDEAMQTLEHFYQEGYRTLRPHRQKNGMRVEGLFVTDCGILFVRHQGRSPDETVELLLSTVEDLNRRLFGHDIKTTASIAWGFFRYHPLTDYEGLEKNYIFGDAYVDAYQDCTSPQPKLDPGMCRVVLKGFDHKAGAKDAGEHPIWSRCRRKDDHLYFYWMCDDQAGIQEVERRYELAHQSPFRVIHDTLQTCSRGWNRRPD